MEGTLGQVYKSQEIQLPVKKGFNMKIGTCQEIKKIKFEASPTSWMLKLMQAITENIDPVTNKSIRFSKHAFS